MSSIGASLPDQRSRWIIAAAMLVFVAWTCSVALNHERWRDEADAWLRARDASFSTIVGEAGYTGSPALWYLLLAPLAKGGLPYASEAALNLLLVAVAAFVVLTIAPFTLPTRVLLVFSYYFVYEYAIVARVYGLSLLLILLVAAAHRYRWSSPWRYAVPLVLLLNTSSHSFLIGGVIVAAWLFEAWKRSGEIDERTVAPALALSVAGGIVAFLQLRPPSDAAMTGWIGMWRPVSLPQMWSESFVPMLPPYFGWIAGVAIAVMLTMALRRQPLHLFVFWSTVALMTYIFVLVYVDGRRHYGYIVLLVVYALWTARVDRDDADLHDDRAVVLLLTATLAVSCASGVYQSVRDIRLPFSGSKEMAAFMMARGYDRWPVAAHQAPNTGAVLAYLPRGTRFWYPATGAPGSYMRYDRVFDRGLYMPFPVAQYRIEEAFRGKGPYLLLANNSMRGPERFGYRLLFSNSRTPFAHPEETFYLYESVPR